MMDEDLRQRLNDIESAIVTAVVVVLWAIAIATLTATVILKL